ncbi:hypothetical protein PMJEKBHI_00615 [Lacticaseibacillus rhamnosus]|nr:hypothetical protein PMJEKBHI_00615 [Lacticaseibacillus rhamnosus]
MTIASTPASNSAWARSNVSEVTPTAAATNNRPWASLAACGNSTTFSISLIVMSPLSRPCLSISGNFSILRACRMASASSIEVPAGAVTKPSLVITVSIRTLLSSTYRKSRFVMIPVSLRSVVLLTIGTPLMRYFFINASASLTGLSAVRKNGSTMTPFSLRLTLSTSSA